ncbi:hypothetical protein [Lentzea sp. E54]|uniref:hypothetical protein n=1 Tax=Lentzea xerophila TaxID=3435883 RepID=UPI003DA38D7B
MTTNPAEVSLTSPRSALAQRVLAGVTIAATAAGMVLFAFSDEPWWAIALWELGMLVVVFLMLALWATATESAKETVALRASSTTVAGEILDGSVYEESDDITYELTLWIPLPDGGFQVRHRCSHHVCSAAAKRGDGQLTVLVDPKVHTWAVVH